MSCRSLLILACLSIFSATNFAQPKDAPKAVVKTTDGNVKPAKDPEAERILKTLGEAWLGLEAPSDATAKAALSAGSEQAARIGQEEHVPISRSY